MGTKRTVAQYKGFSFSVTVPLTLTRREHPDAEKSRMTTNAPRQQRLLISDLLVQRSGGNKRGETNIL
jgi:hypothetical protein